MDRFHLVVANHQRLDSFSDNFSVLKHIDPKKDKIYVLDSSPKSQLAQQVGFAKQLKKYGYLLNKNLYVVSRRNWNLNHGAQLDYLRLLLDNRIPQPSYTIFVQDHYFDQKHNVRSDTLPAKTIFDLDKIETTFISNARISCIFFSRNGIRLTMSNPTTKENEFFWGDNETLEYLYQDTASKHHYYQHLKKDEPIPGSVCRGFYVDGGNFAVKPELYFDYFKQHPQRLTQGDGSYPFSHVWETRLGKILSDQHITWVDMVNQIQFSSYHELKQLEKKRNQSCSKPWYDNRIWYMYYGRDQIRYAPLPLVPVVRFGAVEFMINQLEHDKNTSLIFL